MEGMTMIVYHGSIKRFDRFNIETVGQHLPNDIDTIGIWLTSDSQAAKPFAMGTETVIEKSKTEFWEDGTPKVVQYDKQINGFIYKVFIDEPHLKEYPSYDLFMRERDAFCDYLAAKKKNPTWEDHPVLLNKEEANTAFRNSLIRQGFEGFSVQNTCLQNDITNLYCIFSAESLFIADVIPVDE
jgi:hypothetical protein